MGSLRSVPPWPMLLVTPDTNEEKVEPHPRLPSRYLSPNQIPQGPRLGVEGEEEEEARSHPQCCPLLPPRLLRPQDLPTLSGTKTESGSWLLGSLIVPLTGISCITTGINLDLPLLSQTSVLLENRRRISMQPLPNIYLKVKILNIQTILVVMQNL